ncbi:MAG: DMT family transporter [Candidatus Sabulitectum sp.]|nr:DMT family transporter [Candidatus Sabulitectum sp.]
MGILSFIITLFLFASMEVASKPMMGSIDPLVLTFWRFVCGIAILGVVMAARRKKVKLSPGKLSVLALMGILNTFLSMSFLQLAVKNTEASRAAAIFCSNPVFVVLIAGFLRWEKFTKRKGIGLLLGVAGLVMVTGVYSLKVDTGTVYALLASITFALYVLLSRKASTGMDPVAVNVISFSFGIAALALWLVANGTPMSPEPLKAELPSFLFMGIGISGLGYVTFINTVRKLGAGNASTIFLLKPAVTTVLAIMLLGETVTTNFVIGLVLAGVGSYLVAGEKSRT